jgi:hypothetical protein
MPRARMINLPTFRARDCKRSTAWAWAIHFGAEKWKLVSWALPTKEALLASEKPSPEARPVRITIVPVSGMYRLPPPQPSTQEKP